MSRKPRNLQVAIVERSTDQEPGRVHQEQLEASYPTVRAKLESGVSLATTLNVPNFRWRTVHEELSSIEV